MPYVTKPRPYAKEYQQEKERGEHPRRMERQRARRALDKKLPDGNGNGKADAREGKDVAHRKALDKGGSNKNGTYITTAAKNRSFKRDSQGNLVSETSKKERKKKQVVGCSAVRHEWAVGLFVPLTTMSAGRCL